MSTTLEVADDLMALLKAKAERTQQTVEKVLDETLRQQLDLEPFRIDGPFIRSRPGINLDCAERLLDEVEGPLRK